MSDDVKVFLAALSSCPALALGLTIAAALTDEIADLRHALEFWLFITAFMAALVLAGGGLYFVWTWAL